MKTGVLKPAAGADEAAALLPWESADDFVQHKQRFLADLQPRGAVEAALADRLVWLEWRRRRLALAERAVHLAALNDRLDGSKAGRVLQRVGVEDEAVRSQIDIKAIVFDADEDDAERAVRAADVAATAKAIRILHRGGEDAYARAAAALHVDTRAWWSDMLSGEADGDRAWTACASDLTTFLTEIVAPQDETLKTALDARPAVRLQAYGESFDPDRMERLIAIVARLDRQFEKALSMLLQLQAMRAKAGRIASPRG